MDHEYNVLGGYVPSFVQHLKETSARLGLWIGPQVNEDQTDARDPVTETLSSWTPVEHDVLFRALSVHSRWRPDLIAACVPTKTEWEVWMYLEALEEGAATLAVQRSGFEDERRDVDMDEDLCEPALEVTQAWIDVEERMATWVVQEEYLASIEGHAISNTEDVDDEPPKRKRGRPRGAARGHARTRVRGQTGSNDCCHSHSRSPSPSPSPSPEPTPTSAHRREVVMGHLGAPHLLVLDGILREDEEPTKARSKNQEDSAATPAEHGDEGVPGVRDAEVSSSSHRTTAPRGASNISESVVIDPVLLALSGGADSTVRRVPTERTLASCAPAHVPTHDPSPLPDNSIQPTSFEITSQPGTNGIFVLPPGSAAFPNPDPTANVESDLSLFSPRSRRRVQKRLYMRRKRASLRENDAASEGAVYTGTDKLKPGKKARLERSETVLTTAPCSEAPSDAEMRSSENVSKKNKPGLTLPYKLKAQFTELGVDAAYLRDQGMDLLHLSALGRLMGLCSSMEHDDEEADGSAMTQFISASLVQHLQAAVVSFVTDVIHRGIVWREREIRLKQRSRVWRHGDQITLGAIEHAVEAVGARYHSHKEYFESLGASSGLSSEPATASEEMNPTVEAADRSAEPAGLSPHRDVYTPLVRPPSAWGVGSLACLTRTYEREATRTRRGASAEAEADELMLDETDDEVLAAELKAEDEADARDMRLAATDEEALWDALRY